MLCHYKYFHYFSLVITTFSLLVLTLLVSTTFSKHTATFLTRDRHERKVRDCHKSLRPFFSFPTLQSLSALGKGKRKKLLTTIMPNSKQDSVNNDWNAMAGEWDDMGAPKDYRNCFVDMLWKTTGLDAGDARIVIDFGCGTGLLTEELRNQSKNNSEFICIDPASSMARVVQDKILAGEWNNNTRVHSVALAYLDKADEAIQKDLESMKGKVDLIVASSVMSFVPSDDLAATMKVLGELLKPGGLFCHSDWPQGEQCPDGFTETKANEMYALGGLTAKTIETTMFKMGSDEGLVFFGVAEKK